MTLTSLSLASFFEGNESKILDMTELDLITGIKAKSELEEGLNLTKILLPSISLLVNIVC